MGSAKGDDEATNTSRDESQHRLEWRQALVVLEVVGSVDKVVVKTTKEETHDDHDSRKAPVVKDGHLDKRRSIRLLLKIPLPEEESDDNAQRNNNKNWNPRGIPSNNVTLSESKC